jgi:hypothetical protein
MEAETVKTNIKSMEVSLFARPPASRTTLALEIKLKQYVAMFDCGNLSRSMLSTPSRTGAQVD